VFFSTNCERKINLILSLFLSLSVTGSLVFIHYSVILYFIQQLFTDCLPFVRHHAGSGGSRMNRTNNIAVLMRLLN